MSRPSRGKRLRRGYTRRQFLGATAKAAAAGAAATALPLPSLVPRVGSALPDAWSFSEDELATLRAALAQIIPSEGPGDWSAVDAGGDDYIVTLLSGDNVIYAGGWPVGEGPFQELSPTKEFGWHDEIELLRSTYRAGLADLNARAGGGPRAFVDATPAEQEAILRRIDQDGSPFFAALYDHTMEGVYAHPAYGGNTNRKAWITFGYLGDVHGKHFPAEPGPWQTYGGYSPEEMAQPGKEPQQP